jgi:Cu+-exporting ATPase
MKQLCQKLSNYTIHVLSGDKDKDKELITQLIGSDTNVHFNQTPKDKFDYVLDLQSQGKNVLVVGDGLNDAGALGIANVGIAVSEDIFRFTPSSDGIIKANKLHELNHFIELSAYAKKILHICLGFSLTYNTIGLGFAVLGFLTPLVAAILMPLSSITIVALSTLLVYLKK